MSKFLHGPPVGDCWCRGRLLSRSARWAPMMSGEIWTILVVWHLLGDVWLLINSYFSYRSCWCPVSRLHIQIWASVACIVNNYCSGYEANKGNNEGISMGTRHRCLTSLCSRPTSKAYVATLFFMLYYCTYFGYHVIYICINGWKYSSWASQISKLTNEKIFHIRIMLTFSDKDLNIWSLVFNGIMPVCLYPEN
jgi:hypothetical protein